MSLARRTTESFPTLSGFFDDLFNRDLFNWGTSNFSATNTTIPAVNIKETNDSFEVEVAAPGMKKEDFKIQLDGNTLTIYSENQQEQTDSSNNDQRYTRREFSYQSFQRMFVLPKDVVDEDKIEAKYVNGILMLTIPKREEAKKKGPRLINIA
jgi:HSP20 family protein